MASDLLLPKEIEEAIHAFGGAKFDAGELADDAPISDYRAMLVRCDAAYLALVEAIGSALSRHPAPAATATTGPTGDCDVPGCRECGAHIHGGAPAATARPTTLTDGQQQTSRSLGTGGCDRRDGLDPGCDGIRALGSGLDARGEGHPIGGEGGEP